MVDGTRKNNRHVEKSILFLKHVNLIIILCFSIRLLTGPHSAFGNVSGNRCESDCRSRGREFDPGPVPYFRRD